MLDLDKDLQWSLPSSCHPPLKQPGLKNWGDLEAYLDFLDDVDAFQSVTMQRDPFFYNDEFEL
jgi:hypothetical protein